MPALLTTLSDASCPHRGHVDLTSTANTRVSIGEGPSEGLALLASDVHPIVGCTFMQGNKPSPCVRVEWSRGTRHTSDGSDALLTTESVGTCKNAEGAPQGVASVQAAQGRAFGD